jgi:branched-chain amino acid transport system substrate-binding protein
MLPPVIMRRPWFLAPLAFLALGVLLDGCSLRDVKYDNCSTDDQCALAFGPGSACSGGFCSAAATCTTGADCRKAAGGGACVSGACVSTFPTDPAINDMYTEPSGILSQRADGPNAPLVIGGIFSLAAVHDQSLTDPIRLAVREINANGGLNRGQQLGVIFCDNGGPGDMATGDARAALNVHCLDYLAGTLGVPFVVGPLTSADALTLIAELLAKSYPTVIISPSATSPALSSTNASIPPNKQRLFWRTCPNDALQGQVLAKNVIASVTPAVTSVSVVYINDTYGLGLSQAFQTNFSPTGSTNTTSLAPYDATTPMTPSALTTLANTVGSQNSDAVLVIAEEGSVAIQIVTALAALPAVASKPFFFSDGSMDTSLIAPTLPANVAAIIAKAQGTAPADPSGPNYNVFTANLMTQFGLTTPVSFLAQSYDATYVGAYGVVYASKSGSNYDGFDVATGLGLLESGTSIQVGALGWPTGTGDLVNQGSIDIDGLSGPLQFDPTTGEAPGPILWWNVTGSASAFAYGQVKVVQPM